MTWFRLLFHSNSLVFLEPYSASLSNKAAYVFQALGAVKDLRGVFTSCVDSAKLSGEILAHSLILQFPFRNKSISLLGFSLGTEVILSWLEELQKYNAEHISKSF